MNNPFQPGRRRRPIINVTPLIDVMFILVIFFMVSTTFRSQLGIDLELPQAGAASEQETQPFEIAIDATGAYYFDQKPVDVEGLRAALARLLDEQPEAAVTLRADQAADFGRVLRVIDITRAVGGLKLVIPTAPLDEPDSPPPYSESK